MPTDLRYAVRSLAQSPGFSIISVLSLALGIGANTAIFSLLDAALLRTLPVPEANRLIVLETVGASGRGGSSFSYPLFRHLREHSAAAADIFAYAQLSVNLSADGMTDGPVGLSVSDNYFSALRVQPAMGRTFTAADDAVAVVSYQYWKARFQGSQGIVGRSLTLNGKPFTVVGVGPRGFFGTEVGRSPDIFVPLTVRDRLSSGGPRLAQHNAFWLRVMARLAPEVATPQAAARLQPVYQKYVSDVGGTVSAGLLRFLEQRRVSVVSGAKGAFSIGQQFGTPLRILMATACAVLLVACANVASLLFARGTARRREIAIRLALGAGRARLLRQFSTESVLLAIAGGGLGLFLGFWIAEVLRIFLTDRVVEVSLDARMLGFTALTSAISAFLFGAAPALRATRADLTPALKSGSSDVRPGQRLGRLLVPAQVALSLLLLIGAGLFIRTLTNLRTMDAGFRGDHVVIATVNPGLSRYSPDRVRAFYAELVNRAATLPGVESATIADAPLLGGTYVDGMSFEGSSKSAEVSLRIVAPRFFETMGIRVLAGRDFTVGDGPRSPNVAIINETIARKYFGGATSIGKRIGVAGTADVEIVGVIADTKYRGLRDPIPNTVYIPMEQARFLDAERTLHVRTMSDPEHMIGAIREQIRALDSALPATIRPFSHLIDVNLERERLIATLCGSFAALALLLTSIGLYGVIAHSVQRRTREIGIRISLGAQRTRVLWMVLRDCVAVVAIGIVAAAPLSYWLSGAVRAQLFDVSPHDPGTAVAAVTVLFVVALLAGYLPARRASRVDPVVALRHE
jgi:putative ABC transport system permease protein